jgi:hypothetical protein
MSAVVAREDDDTENAGGSLATLANTSMMSVLCEIDCIQRRTHRAPHKLGQHILDARAE